MNSNMFDVPENYVKVTFCDDCEEFKITQIGTGKTFGVCKYVKKPHSEDNYCSFAIPKEGL